MENKMTIHRALSELKLIDAKIEKNITEITPAGVFQKNKPVNGYVPKDDFDKQAQGKFDAVNDFISRKGKIKSAIVQSNGITKVKVSGREMTVADAINEKAAIAIKKRFIENLTSKLKSTAATMNKSNELVNANVQRILEATFGKDSTKVNETDLDSVRKPYMEANEFHLADPLKVQEKIDSLEKEVSEFETEVDAVLSESNATTFINI